MPAFDLQLAAIRQRVRALWLLGLVLTAGLLNAGGLLRYGETLSHMTGNLTKLGGAVADGRGQALWLLTAILLSFLVGATLSGLAFPKHTASQWRRCGSVLMMGAGLLLLSSWMTIPQSIKVCILALVLGAQNGLALRYRGMLARTTHVTGHLTDCGAALGRMLLGKNEQRREDGRLFLFHLSCLLAFLLGAALASALGPWLQRTQGISMIEVGAVIYILMGLLARVMGSRERI